jgi:hypothetical protein
VLNVDCVSGLFILAKKNKRKTKSRMNNLEIQSTLGTRQGRRKTKEKENQE